jgi:hypothetical protein
MSVIFLIIIVAAWFFAVKSLTGAITSTMKSGIIKKTTYIFLFTFLFLLPVADDIIGGFQFRALCTPENKLIYDAEKVRGKTVKTKDSTTHTLDKIIPIRVLTREWYDADTGEILITHKMYKAKGGWLSQLIGFPGGSHPYTFDGSCSSKEYYELFGKLNITRIEK